MEIIIAPCWTVEEIRAQRDMGLMQGHRLMGGRTRTNTPILNLRFTTEPKEVALGNWPVVGEVGSAWWRCERQREIALGGAPDSQKLGCHGS